jgi:hypothetical protein
MIYPGRQLGCRGANGRKVFAGYSGCFCWNLNVSKAHKAGQKEKLKRQVAKLNFSCGYWPIAPISKTKASVRGSWAIGGPKTYGTYPLGIGWL